MILDPQAADFLKLSTETIADQSRRIVELQLELQAARSQLLQVRSIVANCAVAPSPFPSLHGGS